MDAEEAVATLRRLRKATLESEGAIGGQGVKAKELDDIMNKEESEYANVFKCLTGRSPLAKEVELILC